jgi:serine phosphatase RsbU (regulator of sigma subunit)
MSTALLSLRASYEKAFDDYLASRSEDALHVAYELGRAAVSAQMSILDLSGTHHDVLSSALRRSRPQELEWVTQAAANFFLQALSAFEMVQRGFREAQQSILREKQHTAQLHQLTEASVAINSAKSVQETLQLVTEAARQIIEAQCCIASFSDSEHHRLIDRWTSCANDSEWRGLGEAGLEAIHQLQGDFPRRMDGAQIAQDRTWQTLVRSGAVMRWPKGWLAAPLTNEGDSLIGSIQLFDKIDGDFTENDESILAQLAQVTSVAIENQRLHERDQRIAEGLQRRLLPQKLPLIPDIEMAMRYIPGAAGLNVGGDWFDAITLPGGRTGIAVGDVVGRGVRAASVMGQVRTAFRAYALRGASPKSVIARLNRLIPTLHPEHFSTMIYLVWYPEERLARIVIAGHPPPLIARPGEAPEYLRCEVATPLGVVPEVAYRNVRLELEPGTMMVFYTDGLVEQGDDVSDGMSRLKRSVPDSTVDLEAVCDRVLEPIGRSQATDDIALLAVRFG